MPAPAPVRFEILKDVPKKSASTTGIGLDYFSDKADFDTRAITSCAAQVDKGNEDDEDEEQQQEKQQQASANSESDSPAAINNLVLTGANGGFQEAMESVLKSSALVNSIEHVGIKGVLADIESLTRSKENQTSGALDSGSRPASDKMIHHDSDRALRRNSSSLKKRFLTEYSEEEKENSGSDVDVDIDEVQAASVAAAATAQLRQSAAAVQHRRRFRRKRGPSPLSLSWNGGTSMSSPPPSSIANGGPAMPESNADGGDGVGKVTWPDIPRLKQKFDKDGLPLGPLEQPQQTSPDGTTAQHYALVGRSAEQPYGHFPFHGKNSYNGGMDIHGRRQQQQQKEECGNEDEELGHTLILRDNSDDDSGVGAINFATTMLSTVVRRSSTNASSEADVAKKNSSNNYYYSVTGDDDDDDDVMPVSQGVAVSASLDQPDGRGERRSSSNEIVAIDLDTKDDGSGNGEDACDTDENNRTHELLSAPSFPRSFGLSNSMRSINHTLETSTEVEALLRMVKLLELDKQAMLMEMAGDARDNASILEKNEQLLIRAQEQLAESEEGRRQLKHELEIAHNEKKALELRIQALMKGSTDTSSKSSEGNSTRRRLFPLFGRNEKSLSSADYYNVVQPVNDELVQILQRSQEEMREELEAANAKLRAEVRKRHAMQNTLLIAEEEIHRLRSEADSHAGDARDALQDVDIVIRKLSEKLGELDVVFTNYEAQDNAIDDDLDEIEASLNRMENAKRIVDNNDSGNDNDDDSNGNIKREDTGSSEMTLAEQEINDDNDQQADDHHRYESGDVLEQPSS